MASSTIYITASLGSVSFNTPSAITKTNTPWAHSESLEAGIAATIDSQGSSTVILPDGHNLDDEESVDVYWTSGSGSSLDYKVRYNCTLNFTGDSSSSSSSGAEDTATLTGGGGDALPADGTSVVIGKKVAINLAASGDTVDMLLLNSTKRGYAEFFTSVPARIDGVQVMANETWAWWKHCGTANILDGETVATIHVSNGETSAATFKVGFSYDPSP